MKKYGTEMTEQQVGDKLKRARPLPLQLSASARTPISCKFQAALAAQVKRASLLQTEASPNEIPIDADEDNNHRKKDGKRNGDGDVGEA